MTVLLELLKQTAMELNVFKAGLLGRVFAVQTQRDIHRILHALDDLLNFFCLEQTTYEVAFYEGG